MKIFITKAFYIGCGSPDLEDDLIKRAFFAMYGQGGIQGIRTGLDTKINKLVDISDSLGYSPEVQIIILEEDENVG